MNRQTRTLAIDSSRADRKSRTVPVTLSSEYPVDRGVFIEVLSHDAKAVDLVRAPLPLLEQHNMMQLNIGRVVNLHVSKRKLKGTLELGNSERANELWPDIEAGIVANVSISYEILETRREGDTVTATRWMPYEASLVSVPADPYVGINRSFPMNTTTNDDLRDGEGERLSRGERRRINADSAALQAAAEQERERVSSILAAGAHFKCDADAQRAVADGTSLDDFRANLLERISKRRTPALSSADTHAVVDEPREFSQFSLWRAINAQFTGDWRHAGLEREVSQELAKRMGKQPAGIYMPLGRLVRRDLTKGVAADGGHLVPTEHRGDLFINLLRNRMKVMELGATVLQDLHGNIAIPRQTATATVGWVAENSAVGESQPAFDQVTMSPKSVGAYTDFSRKLVLQSSPEVEQIVRQDLAARIAIEIDRAAIHGSGASNEPTGILATAGIGSVVGGANGAAPTHSHIVQLESEVANDNADLGNLGYLTNSRVRGKLKVTEVVATTGQMVWGTGPMPLNGYRAEVSNQVSNTLTKGASGAVCSAIIFGNWADLLIGMWGALDVLVDPYTLGTSGGVRVRAMQDLDIAVRHAESFAAMVDALTT